jgi:hypothetical protein
MRPKPRVRRRRISDKALADLLEKFNSRELRESLGGQRLIRVLKRTQPRIRIINVIKAVPEREDTA